MYLHMFSGGHQNNRQILPERRQPRQNLSRNIDPEAAAPSAYHASLRGDGIASDDLPGHGVCCAWRDLRPSGGQCAHEGGGGGPGVCADHRRG